MFGKLQALCTFIRCILLTLHVVRQVQATGVHFDVIFVDQVSVVIPLLKAFTKSKVLFYCHFPDLLLAQRSSLLRRVYRSGLDWLEETTTGAADCLLVNSKFTQSMFRSTFKRLTKQGITPEVLYPAVNIPSDAVLTQAAQSWRESLEPELMNFLSQGPVFLSINRFERKKGLQLCLEALKELLDRDPSSPVRLVLAGGYDARVRENVEHLTELQELTAQLHLEQHVRFIPSFTDAERQLLLAVCVAVVYTPQNEHFGIVPLEAMAAGRPVVACNSGGPMESIMHDRTGLLCDPTPVAFGQAMASLLQPSKAEGMGKVARQHVQKNFSLAAFGDCLDAYLWSTTRNVI